MQKTTKIELNLTDDEIREAIRDWINNHNTFLIPVKLEDVKWREGEFLIEIIDSEEI